MPGGSGNALNCSLLRQLGQPLDGLNGLGAEWSAQNVAEGIDKDKTVIKVCLFSIRLKELTQIKHYL